MSSKIIIYCNSAIITITNSLNIIGEFAASFFTNHFIQLKPDNVIGQLAVMGHL